VPQEETVVLCASMAKPDTTVLAKPLGGAPLLLLRAMLASPSLSRCITISNLCWEMSKGEWLDLVANSTGYLLGTIISDEFCGQKFMEFLQSHL